MLDKFKAFTGVTPTLLREIFDPQSLTCGTKELI